MLFSCRFFYVDIVHVFLHLYSGAPPENDADPYEDVGNVKKSKPLGKSKQSVAPKPSSRGMAPQKPGSSPTFQVQQVGSSDELYAMVSLTNKG